MYSCGLYCAILRKINLGKDYRVRRTPRYRLALVFVTTFCMFIIPRFGHKETPLSGSSIYAKIFTGEPQNPYAEAVAIRGEKIVTVARTC